MRGRHHARKPEEGFSTADPGVPRPSPRPSPRGRGRRTTCQTHRTPSGGPFAPRLPGRRGPARRGTASALAIRRGDEAGWRAEVFVSPGPSRTTSTSSRIIRDGLAELGLGPGLGSGQVGDAQAEPGRAVEGGASDQHPPGGGPGRRRGLPAVGRPRGLRRRGAGALPRHRLRPRAIRPRDRSSTRPEARIRRPQPRRRLLEAEPPRFTDLRDRSTLPASLKRADLVVSLPKMKTHHWAGVTLAMKNLFGVMPGVAYGWPKNVLHHAGIPGSILDINAAVRPALAIVDGIVGMEGDGPIMGTPRSLRRSRDGDESPERRRHGRPLDGDRPGSGLRTSPAPRAGSARSPRSHPPARRAGRRSLARAVSQILDHPSLAYLRR